MKKSYQLTLIPICVFIASLFIGLNVTNNHHQLWKKEQTLLIQELVSSQALTIQQRLSRSLSSTYFLKSLLEINEGRITDFNNLAANIIESLGGITNLQLAPNGIVTNIHPLKGHEKALQHNILVDDRRREEALLAVTSKKLTLAGPFELIQGGVAVIGRNPVFLKGENNTDQFWGFASVLIYLDELIASTDLDQLKDKGYFYTLAVKNKNTGEYNTFSLSHPEVEPDQNMIKQVIKVPNAEWLLCMGRLSQSGHQLAIGLQVALVAVLSLLIAWLSYLLLKQPLILREMVAQKTVQLNNLAFYDPLTKLCNRRLFNDLLIRNISGLKRGHSKMALLYIDLDHFKRVNDTLGHEAGDQLLKVIGERISKTLRKTDIAARLGGDEFSIILPEIKNDAHAGRVAEKIQHSIQKPIQLGEHTIRVTSSIGITLAPDDGTDVTELMKNADLAMYKVKEKNRNDYQFFSPSFHTDMLDRLALEKDLSKGISKNEFILHFQPQVSLASGKIVGIEALVRWQHAHKGMLYPGKFIRVAEDTGLILPLGSWIIHNACSSLKQLNRPELKLAINLSTRQLADPDLVKTVRTALRCNNIEPHRLELEITETTLMENMQHAIDILNEIKALGVNITIDDFGTGYSSLSQLKNLPVDVLKIDHEFTDNLSANTDDGAITDVIINMGHKLGLAVVAEGVETEAQFNHLKALRCDMAQGYFFYRPMELQSLLKVLDQTTATQPTTIA